MGSIIHWFESSWRYIAHDDYKLIIARNMQWCALRRYAPRRAEHGGELQVPRAAALPRLPLHPRGPPQYDDNNDYNDNMRCNDYMHYSAATSASSASSWFASL